MRGDSSASKQGRNTMQWNTKIVIQRADGCHQSITSVAEAETMLLDSWPLFEPESLGTALKACLLSNPDPESAEFARNAFERAARCSGILLPEAY